MSRETETIDKKLKVDQNWKQLIKSCPELLEGKKRKARLNKDSKRQQTSSLASDEDDIWFDGVDPIHFEPQLCTNTDEKFNPLVKDAYQGLTKIIAMDCEMVGIDDDESVLARVSIVNQFGHCVYDKYVKPIERVTNYRTEVSGIRPSDLENGADFKLVQKEVSEILQNRILVGHAIHHDLKVLFLSHPRKDIRDTSRYKPFTKLFNGRTPALRNITRRLLGIEVQTGEHDSIQDAQATMRLYTLHKRAWEAKLKMNKNSKKFEAPKKQVTKTFDLS
ncbi:REX4, RNA exonuclease 4 [Chamberlinius hualienensis]